MKKRLIIVGGHGSGEIAMSVFQEMNRQTNEWIIEGFLNDIIEPGKTLGQYPVLGPSEAVLDFVKKGYYVHYTLHFNAKAKHQRVELLEAYQIPLEQNATAVHPRAYLDPSTKIGYGCVLCAYATTSFGAIIGHYNHLYTNCFVGHNSEIKNYVTQAAHSVLGGRNIINDGAHIGLNSTTREDITIGKYAIIGMGSVITKDVADYSVMIGNPGSLLNNRK